MEHFYAQLNDDSIVVGVSQLSGKVEASHMIPISDYDASLLRKKFNRASQEFEAGLPRTITRISSREFWKRFTAGEREALSSSTSPKVKRFLEDLRITKEVDLLDAEVIADMKLAENAGLIGVGRAAGILTPEFV